MAKASIIAAGVIMIAAMFVFSHIIINPQQKAEIELASSIYKSPLGQTLAAFSSQLTQAGYSVVVLSQILSLEIPVYFVGFGLILLGAFLGKKKPKEKREVEEEIEEDEEEIGITEKDWEELEDED